MTNISNLNNKKVLYLGTASILRLKNTDFDTYDYYHRGDCFFSSPIREGFLKGDKQAKQLFNTL